jgi:proteasome accessory factor A
MNPSACVPKLSGADIELGNFIEGADDHRSSAGDAALALLAEIRATHGLDHLDPAAGENERTDPQDRGRSFLPGNGGCVYIDLDHLEICIPEVRGAHDHVAWQHAMYRVASDAQRSLNDRRAPDARIHVLANNSDGLVSYGGHFNLMISRDVWDAIIHRKTHYLAYLAAFQVSSLPLTGQGKVGSANGAPPVSYQLSQRADWFATLSGPQTTVMRPLVNSRDEALCGSSRDGGPSDYARLHSIFFDTTLCEGSSLLRVGTMQLVLASVEAGILDVTLALDDPLAAVRQWSHDATLRAPARLVSGELVTALALQRRFCDLVAPFVEAGGADQVVPRAREILALWSDTLTRLEARDWETLARRLDWVLKLSMLERAFRQQPRLGWDSPELRHLDQVYASLDHRTGLYWNVADHDLVERYIPAGAVERCVREPPGDTRAWCRAQLLRKAGSAAEGVDWDHVTVRLREGHGSSARWRVPLADPLGSGSATNRRIARPATSITESVRLLGGVREVSADRHESSNYAAGYWPAALSQWQSGRWPLRPTTYNREDDNNGST